MGCAGSFPSFHWLNYLARAQKGLARRRVVPRTSNPGTTLLAGSQIAIAVRRERSRGAGRLSGGGAGQPRPPYF